MSRATPIHNVFRTDPTNVGDWYCAPARYFPRLGNTTLDILHYGGEPLPGDIVVGGGGLVARTFHERMALVSASATSGQKLVAWGIGESEHVDRSGATVAPFAGAYPAYLARYDCVGVRDFGTQYAWVPCVSCLLPQFDSPGSATNDVVIYEHKRIPIPIDEGFPRMTNAGSDIDQVLAFLQSGDLVITNSYHGAYWATLLGKRVVAIPNMSKMYRMKHAPSICNAESWRRYSQNARRYPEALAECRAANLAFADKVFDKLGD